jgi:hypothetical protein
MYDFIMNEIEEIYKYKYRISKKMCDFIVKNNNELQIMKYIYVYEKINFYVIFPAINIIKFDELFKQFKTIEFNNSFETNINKKNSANKYVNKYIKQYILKNDIIHKKYVNNNIFKELFLWNINSKINNIFNIENINESWIEFSKIINSNIITDLTNDINHISICEPYSTSIYVLNYYAKKKYKFNIVHFKNDKISTKLSNEYNKYIHVIDNIKKKNIIHLQNKISNNDLITINCDIIYNNANDTTIIGKIILALAIASKGSKLIFMIDIHNKLINQIIYMLYIFYEHIYNIDPMSSNYNNNNIYFVCTNFKYNSNDPKYNSNIDNIMEWFKLYSTSKNINLFNSQTINSINDIINKKYTLIHKKIILKCNNVIFTMNNIHYKSLLTFVRNKMIMIYDHYTNYYITTNKIMNQTTKFILIKNKKYTMKRYIDLKNDEYIKFLYPTDPIMNNEIFMKYVFGKTYIINYIYNELPINPIFHTDKTFDKIKAEFYIVSKRLYNSISSSFNKYVNIYNNVNILRSIDRIIKYSKEYNSNIKHMNAYFWTSRNINSPQFDINQYTGIMKRFNINIEITLLPDPPTNIKIVSDSIYFISFNDNLYTTIKNVIIIKILIEIVYNLINNIDNNSIIVLFLTYKRIVLFDIINLFSKYFTNTKIIHLKYYLGPMLCVMFSGKKHNVSANECNNILSICNNNIRRIYSDDIIGNYITQYNNFVSLYKFRQMLITNVAWMKLNDNVEYKLILDKLNNLQKYYNDKYIKYL